MTRSEKLGTVSTFLLGSIFAAFQHSDAVPTACSARLHHDTPRQYCARTWVQLMDRRLNPSRLENVGLLPPREKHDRSRQENQKRTAPADCCTGFDRASSLFLRRTLDSFGSDVTLRFWSVPKGGQN